jgi:hypothetical protein
MPSGLTARADADIQKQGLRAVYPKEPTAGRGPVQGRRGCDARVDRCRSWRRRHQAADRAQGWRQVGRVSDDHPVSRRRAGIFVHGFAKNEKDNIEDDELAAFKLLAAQMQSYSDAALAKAIENGTLTEVMCDD